MDVSLSQLQEECILNDSNRGLSGDIDTRMPLWSYYERTIYSVNCSDRFECPNAKCINQTSVGCAFILFTDFVVYQTLYWFIQLFSFGSRFVTVKTTVATVRMKSFARRNLIFRSAWPEAI